ncbi:hypothetical protein NW752_007240 [Fusarium irregulare]|uniref:YPC1-Alkaline Ceramidase n=1 Tax=Fusarium irregulare TaxID=2494466 RepID=A0A9W8PMX9_9HYPO|nr:hypothetical protein NW766_007864 [Fusarium irregulare]KAJ4014478.1 hypothetical protein NW752_007240 [Fusarium irregulare]
MGHHNLRFDGDPHSLSGVWSPPTSRANFCEEDYAITFYLAEFINALTNVTYVYLALRSMYGPRSRSRGLFDPKWDFMSISLMVLGFGSFLFHATLRQTLEFVDELSMMLLSWSMLRSLLILRQSPTNIRYISIVLAIFFISFSVFYVIFSKIIYQVIAFWVSLILVGVRVRYLFNWAKPGFSEENVRNWSVRVWTATFTCLFGYLIWNIDLEFCHELRNLRERIGLPWAFLLEFHGWWHILTAVGASQFMNVVREVREEVDREKKE